ncbi:Gibberellin 20 oxidase 1-B [Linum perenne]
MNEFFQLPVEEKLKFKSNCVGLVEEEDGYSDGYGFDETLEEGGSQEWEIMEECSSKAEKLLEQVLKGMARSLELAEDTSLAEEIGGEPCICTSNGMFKSRLHRAAVNAERPRKSVAIFCAPELDKAIGPVDGGTKLAKYKVVKNYEREFFKQAYNRAFIDSLKL